MTKIILGIETSCDETSAAILKQDENGIKILSNIVATSLNLQEKYGGVIPEKAAREQLKSMTPVIKEAFLNSKISLNQIDALAITQGPGLIGSLLVGVETAKTLSLIWQKPLIPINHLIGHFYANWIKEIKNQPQFPLIGLLVSGGHSDLVLFKNHNDYTYLGGTRDDAAGECFDKCARLIGYPYPGGPKISKIAENGDPNYYKLPRPLSDSKDLDFSFSGLKTAFSNLVEQNFKITNKDPKNPDSNWRRIQTIQNKKAQKILANMCASIEQAIIDSLIKKTILALKLHPVKTLIVAGGVAANQKLQSELQQLVTNYPLPITLHVPPAHLCTDNAAMIASAAFFQTPTSTLNIQANPNLSLAY